MNEFRRLFTTWFYSNPRRWVWVGVLLVVILILALTGNLR
jgi:hypothetical protein